MTVHLKGAWLPTSAAVGIVAVGAVFPGLPLSGWVLLTVVALSLLALIWGFSTG